MKRASQSARNATAAWVAALLLTVLAPASARAKVYFSAFLPEGTGIVRAGFDGSAQQTLQAEPTGFADGLALDTADGRMYWTDTNASIIESANMNGTGTQIVLDDFGAEPFGIALDLAGGKMYWTDREGVKRANLDGTEQQVITHEPARGFCALDLVAKRIYWADWPSGTIKSAPMVPEATVTTVVTKQPAPFGMAVDHGGGKVYWIELNLSKKKREKNEIRRANLDGSEVQTILERPGAGFEGGLAFDPVAGKLYWTEAETRLIGVANLDGSQPRTLFSTGEAIPVDLAVETSEPHPTDTTQPFIEGVPQVGSTLRCNPGSWTGVGPVLLSYQWSTTGGPIEGAGGSAYVAASEDAGNALLCTVTATDNVETTAASSEGLSIAPYPSPTVTPQHARLVAGIAFSRLHSTGRVARVPVFTSASGSATLRATPTSPRHRSRFRSSRNRATRPITVIARQRLRAGRALITLKRLVPGVTYRLQLTIVGADGQTARDTAMLKVARR